MNLIDIWDRIDDANLIENAEQRASSIEDAIRNLRQLVDGGDDVALYPLGYAYYCHPNRRTLGSAEALEMAKALNLAIKSGVERSLSYLYLAFHFFDVKDFVNAKHHAELVVEKELDEMMAVKLDELKLCIAILVDGIENSISCIRRFSSHVNSLTVPAVPPLVLMNVLENELKCEWMSDSLGSALYGLELAYPILGKNAFTRLLDKPS